ncbi:nucleotidyltransferase family protein [Mycolicibacterium pyrenivorans]|uniref:nucleotidyltransferase family protein n=1 Tax=Mycolicibacterium pyrenivorans TaxID=187102 RepID=UPI0021F385EB|nr:NTP transferase domain-containing protein [Mycolicibacterium pyrenivorans]MCV7149914.1 NTP transferase domain-containing protein [Mycolicibacterium pyrenivorans]
MAQNFSVSGVLLAAGAGTRYGMPKVLADGGEWLRRGVAALRDGGCGDVVVVLGAAVVDVPSPARAVVAEEWAQGVSASVRAGLLALRDDAEFAVLTTVDTPDVGAAAVARVLAAARASESGLARARYGERPGHPVVIARRHWPQVLDALTGDEGAGPFLRVRDDVVVVDCADLGSGLDVDER